MANTESAVVNVDEEDEDILEMFCALLLLTLYLSVATLPAMVDRDPSSDPWGRQQDYPP